MRIRHLSKTYPKGIQSRRNTLWELDTERATAEQTEARSWQVSLAVRARRAVFDPAGVETDVPMDDWVVQLLAKPPRHQIIRPLDDAAVDDLFAE